MATALKPHDNDSTLIGTLLASYATYRAGKGIFRLISGPLAVSGIAFYLYRKYQANRDTRLA